EFRRVLFRSSDNGWYFWSISAMASAYGCFQGIFSAWRCKKKVVKAHNAAVAKVESFRANRITVHQILEVLPFRLNYKTLDTSISYLPIIMRAMISWQHFMMLRRHCQSVIIQRGLLITSIIFVGCKN